MMGSGGSESSGLELIAQLRADPQAFSGQRWNELLREFSRGLPLDRLRDLLTDDDERVAAVALFVTEELGRKAVATVPDLVGLLRQDNPRLRASSLKALAGCLSPAASSGIVHLVRDLVDPDSCCRKIAALALMRTTLDLAEGVVALHASEEALTEGLNWLMQAVDLESSTIRAWLSRENPLHRLFAVIAAGRIAQRDPEVLNEACRCADSEVRAIADAQLVFREIVARHRRRQNET